MKATEDHTFQPFRDEDVERSVPEIFEACARVNANSLAVAGLTHRFTYAELNRFANRIAHYIIGALPRDTGPATVALLLDHDAPIVAALLGVLKAGCVCTALEPTHPAARSQHVLSDCQPALILTDSLNIGTAKSIWHDARIIVNIDELDALRSDDPRIPINSESPATILYTSGSTGRPKGVVRSHRVLLHGARNPINIFRITSNDRLGVFAAAATGQAMTPIWCALLSGASLRMFPLKQEGLATLSGWIRAEGITIYQSSTTVFRYLGRILEADERLPSLRVVRLGGEPVVREDIEIYRRHCGPDCLFANVLSTTEVSTMTMFIVDQRMAADFDMMPVGYPVSGKDVQIADAEGRTLPSGETGEFIVRSRFAASGYWQDPELTALRFVPQPDGTVLYRTGDLGRMRPDGCFEHLGRRDHRIKIRGYRIEIEELEACLARHPDVHTAALTVESNDSADGRLVAYLTVGSRRPRVAELRNHLLESVPDHMVPALFVFVDAIPLTPSGKIDRRALAKLPATSETTGFVPPRTPMERRLAGIWSTVLHAADANVDADFFVLGGDSLRAAQILSRVASELGVQVPFRAFLKHPTIATLAKLVEESTDRQDHSAVVTTAGAITPRDRAVAPPLSFSQQRLWLIDRLIADRSAYNVPRAVRLRGPIDVGALQRALDTIVRRHAPLRTTIAMSADEPMQIISDTQSAEFRHVELQGPPDEQDEALRHLLEAESRRPFDLTRDVLLRALLVRLSSGEHVLLLVKHHIASDGWSAGILAHELSLLYSAEVAGQSPSLTPLPIEYGDYAAWQRQRLSEDFLAPSLRYWVERLRDAPEILALPTDRPRPAIRRARGARLSVSLSPRLTAMLESRAREEDATLFMILLAAFQTFLHRYSGQDDIVVGSPVAGRLRPETEPLIGFFVNTLLFRTSMAGDPTFRQLLRRVRESVLDDYEHQELPFERLVQELEHGGRLDHSPLAQVFFGLSQGREAELTLPGVASEPLDVDPGSAKFDVTLSLSHTSAGLSGYVEYDTDLFDRSTAERMMAHFSTLLEGIVSDCDRAISVLPMLSDKERQRAVVDWNQTATDLPVGTTLYELFSAQVARTPAAAAIADGAAQWTYDQLRDRASVIAQRLRSLGVRPDSRVAVVMDRSADFVAVILGIIEVGGAYVPIDPTLPNDRVERILNDAEACVVVSHADEADGYKQRDCASLRPPARDVTPERLAYVLYTSGSSGEPKGVAVPHRAVIRLVISSNFVTLGQEDVVAHASNPAFDAATFEIWGALLNGARLVILPRATLLSPRALRDALVHEKITTLFVTTALFNVVAQEEPSIFRSVRNVLFGGETANPSAVARVLAAGPPARLLHVYGPTETTTFAAWYEVNRVAPGASAVPIGKPLSNTELFILDEARQPVPIGVAGELYIGGPGVACGYLNNPDLTNERFVPHPFRPSDRVYRSGDLAYYQADGNIVFAGRTDDQVKLRGFRIELAEVENAINRHPRVRQCVVVPRREGPNTQQLIAYVAAHEHEAISQRELREVIAHHLPDFMVPSTFVLLDALPMTANGKIDRALLPEPVSFDRQTPWLPPEGPLEERIADVWRAVLGIDRVGRVDSFFELGGHSLQAVQVISRLDRELGRPIPVTWLYECPTLSEFAARLQSLEEATRTAGINRRLPGHGPIAASIVQEEAWHRREVYPAGTGYMVVRAFDVRGDFDVRAFAASLNEIVARHEILRTALRVDSGQLVQIILEPYPVDVLERDLSNDPNPEAEAERVLVHEVHRPFDLACGPWLRAAVLRLGPDRSRLLFALPHMVYDGWALDLIFREIEWLYAAKRFGKSCALPRVPLQYADCVLWQRQQSEASYDAQIAYWRNRLENLPAPRLPMRRRARLTNVLQQATRLQTLPLLNTHAAKGWLFRAGSLGRAVISARANGHAPRLTRHPIVLTPSLVTALRSISRAEDCTLFVTLLAAFKAALARHTAVVDISVATMIANRSRPELHGVMGNFGNTLVLRTNLSGDLSFQSLLGRVRETVFSAQANADVPFSLLSRTFTKSGQLPIEYRVPVVFQLIERLRVAPRFAGTEVTHLETMSRHQSIRMYVILYEDGEGVRGSCNFDGRLYDSRGCRAVVDEFIAILEAADSSRGLEDGAQFGQDILARRERT